jgi:hypothetical protein
MKYHINRSTNLCNYLDSCGWEKAGKNEISDFSYWDTHKASKIQSHLMVWDKNYTQRIDNLLSFHKYLEDLKITHLAPYTILDWRNPKQRLSENDFSQKDIWFMKHVAGVHGKGINILSSYDDYLRWLSNENNLQHHFVLQKCIYHSHLLDDKKYILRVYFLTIGSKCYLYHDCLYYTALFPLNNDFKDTYITEGNQIVSKDKDCKFIPKEQIRINTHVSHWKVDTELKNFGITDTRIKGKLSDLPEYKTIMKNILKNGSQMCKLFERVFDEYCHDGSCSPYHIWGADYLVLPDLDVKCIEINAYPLLTHGIRGKFEQNRPFEMEFRNSGFDRDLMRRLGYDLENKKNNYNSWIILDDRNSKRKKRRSKKRIKKTKKL